MLSEQQEEQALKALRDTHSFLMELDKIDRFYDSEAAGVAIDVLKKITYNIKANASRVRAEVSHALLLMGKL